MAWRDLILSYFYMLVLSYTSDGHLQEEKQCPHKLDPYIFSSEHWVVPGAPFRAWRTLPYRLFRIAPSRIPGAGMGVFAETFIPRYTWLGEYEGEFWNLRQAAEEDDYSYTWRVYTNDEVTHYVDAKADHLSNWVRFINCPRHVVEESVKMMTCYGHVYYITVKDVAPGQELYIFYGNDYAKNTLNIDINKYHNMTYASEYAR